MRLRKRGGNDEEGNPLVAPGESRLAVSGCVLVAAGAYAATNWVVGLNAGSSGEGQFATIANLSITAVASPAPSNVLFPGGTGDVVVTIANTNSYPVTITAVNLPANTVQAGGFTTSALTTAQTGCSTKHERGHLELRYGDQWHIAHTDGAPDRRSERSVQQPARRHPHQRRHSWPRRRRRRVPTPSSPCLP